MMVCFFFARKEKRLLNGSPIFYHFQNLTAHAFQQYSRYAEIVLLALPSKKAKHKGYYNRLPDLFIFIFFFRKIGVGFLIMNSPPLCVVG